MVRTVEIQKCQMALTSYNMWAEEAMWTRLSLQLHLRFLWKNGELLPGNKVLTFLGFSAIVVTCNSSPSPTPNAYKPSSQVFGRRCRLVTPLLLCGWWQIPSKTIERAYLGLEICDTIDVYIAEVERNMASTAALGYAQSHGYAW